MEIKVNKSVFDAIPEEQWASIEVDESRRMAWQKSFFINLASWPLARVKKLRELLAPLKKGSPASRSVAVLLRDLDTWIGIVERGDRVQSRSVGQFIALLTEALRKVPGHRVYKKDEDRDCWFAYYVEKTHYVPPRSHGSGEDRRTEPAYGQMHLVWYEFGIRQRKIVAFHSEVIGKDPTDALASAGYYVETPELREQYNAEVEHYNEIAPKIGYQLAGTGMASTDLDGNTDDDDGRDRWWRWWRSNVREVRLDHEGEPARLVVDVFKEANDTKDDDDEPYWRRRSSSRDQIDVYFWSKKNIARKHDGEDEPVEDDEDDDESEGEQTEMKLVEAQGPAEQIEAPIHPILACFDLKRHLRVKVHIGSTEDHVHDVSLGSRLILPNDVRDLVGMLIGHRSAFKDAVSGKGGGAAILCAGPPGTGKTLTAEVYAEVMRKPLYSVQAAQLGIGERELEKNLLKVFKRAQRWNAILLIDEADVYVMKRGNDLTQNAVVATFLRVLEYYSGILFFTTNRADLVDDAIASRCIARIDYRIPHVNDQKRIWRVMAEQNAVELSDETIDAIVDAHNDLSGRDIKNVLKLARLVSKTRKRPIDVEMISFVKRFKPTGKAEGEREESEGGGLVIEKAARAPRKLED